MSASLEGRVALVSGTSRGIGKAVAERLHEAGATVVGVSRTLTPARAERRLDFSCDLTVPDAVDDFVAQAVGAVGVPDIVVNNAGALLIKPVQETDPGEFRAQIEANVVGPFFLVRCLVPHLITRGTGHVVTIGSVADHQPFPGNAAYAAAKYGLRGLHEVLAVELKPAGIRATLIAPGATDTSMWDSVDLDSNPGFLARQDMLQPVDVADCVLFAVSRPSHANVDVLHVTPTA